ncbi:hypothetical protein [Aeromonas veronii]|uniref:hypothetical protein n=1 Tax=Aeromonas veronii TaxID=654 RepID=UPI003BA05BE9
MTSINFHPFLLDTWHSIPGILNSAFISAFLSSLAGAGLGVLGAQKLAERATRRKELLDALRQANALTVLVATITNQAMRIKEQHIEPLSKSYFDERKRAESINKDYVNGNNNISIEFTLDIFHIPPLSTKTDTLNNLAHSTPLLPGKALALIFMVEQALIEMSHSIKTRSEQIELFKSQDMTSMTSIQNYFGLIRRDGCINLLYHDSIVNVRDYTDDVIFFAVELAEELQAHANNIHKKLLKLTKDAGKVNTVDYSTPRQSGLIPSKKNYEGWLSEFKNHD